jgi:tetratricopeptide (TPR) repeat protein
MKKLRILFITVILVILCNSALSQGKQFEKGHAAYLKGEYSNAIPFFIECTKLAPQDGDYYRWLGYAYDNNGQYQEAVESFKKGLNLPHSKNTDKVWFNLAYAYENLGEYDLAISSQKKMIELEPDSSKNFVRLSRYYRENKQYDEAITAAKRAIELNPDNGNGYISLGAAYGKKKQYDEAIKALRKSIEINPGSANAYDWMGSFLMEDHAYSEAVSAYLKVIEAAPNEPNFHRILSRAYYFMGSYDDALVAMNKEIELLTIPGGIGISYNAKDVYPVVIEVIDPGPAKKADLQIGDKIIAINGKSTKGWNIEKVNLGLKGTAGSQVILTIGRTGNKIEKTVTREKIVQKAAASSIGLRSLIYRQKGKLNEAFNDAEMASSLDTSENNVKIAVGAAYLDRGQYDESIKMLAQIKDDPAARLLEAIANTKSGKINEAINIYSLIPKEDLSEKNIPLMNDQMVLMKIFQPLVKQHKDKAAIFESKKQYKETLSELSEALKISDNTEAQAILEKMFSIIRENPILAEVPEDARRYAIRGEMLVKEGNFEQASKEFKMAIQNAPYIAKLYYNTALVDGELKKYPEAIRQMKIYIQADPDSPSSRTAKDMIIKWEFMMEKEK